MRQPKASWWYLSYASDDGWKGAVIVRGMDFLDACRMAKRLKIAPCDVEVRGGRFNDSVIKVLPEEVRNRLLTREDLIKHWGGLVDWP